jgi:hypothetical protein
MDPIYLGKDTDGNAVYRTKGTQSNSSNCEYRVDRGDGRSIFWEVNPCVIAGLKANMVTGKDEIYCKPDQRYYDKLAYFKELEAKR